VERTTIVSISSRDKDIKDKIEGYTGNKASASIAGKVFGEKLQEKGISKAVFDRNGFLYHGRVKSLADGIREVGIKF
jgi:large subunit ribosomal protein L18